MSTLINACEMALEQVDRVTPHLGIPDDVLDLLTSFERCTTVSIPIPCNR